MVFEFVAELGHDANRWHSRCVAERAEGAAQHIFRKLADHIYIFRAAEPVVEAIEHFAQPSGAFAAGNAPATGFVSIEMHNAASHVDHAGIFVDDHHAARTEHGAGFGYGVVVHGHIDFVSLEERAGAAAGNNRFQFFAARNTTRHLVDELFHVHAQGNFVDAGLIDVPGDTKEARAAVFRRAAIGIRFAAFENDRRNGAKSFDVVDDGRAAVKSDDRRKGRLDAGISALAFEGFHERRFFATLVGARAGMDDELEIETGTEDILAQIAARIGFRDSGVHKVQDIAVFATNVNETVMGANGAARDNNAFDQLVRVHFHQRAILAGTGLGLVGVADDVFGLGGILRDEGPLHAGGKACAATSAEIRFLDFVDDLLRRHGFQDLVEGLVSAMLERDIDLVRIFYAETLADEGSFEFVALVERARNDRNGGRTLALV